jgi:hypothetical protein
MEVTQKFQTGLIEIKNIMSEKRNFQDGISYRLDF